MQAGGLNQDRAFAITQRRESGHAFFIGPGVDRIAPGGVVITPGEILVDARVVVDQR